jgi:hypothetical protein
MKSVINPIFFYNIKNLNTQIIYNNFNTENILINFFFFLQTEYIKVY